MPVIDFPPSPVEGNLYASGSTTRRFDGQKWVIVPFESPTYGVVDGGDNSGVGNIVRVSGGTSFSTFGSATAMNGGTPS